MAASTDLVDSYSYRYEAFKSDYWHETFYIPMFGIKVINQNNLSVEQQIKDVCTCEKTIKKIVEIFNDNFVAPVHIYDILEDLL